MDLSIIIVTYKGFDKLRKCLESISNFEGRFSFEVIVVDNNDEETGTGDIENQFPGFRFIHPGINGGFAYGNNTGSRIAGGSYLLFLNPDTIVTEEAVDTLLRAAMADQDFAILSCRQADPAGNETRISGSFPRLYSLTGFQRSVLKLFTRDARSDNVHGEIVPADWVSGSVILISSSRYRELGGFYEGFWMYYEDVDLCRRAADAGWNNGFIRNAVIEHSHGGSSRTNLKTASITKSEVKISQHLYVARHFKNTERFIGQIFLTVNNMVSGLAAAVVGLIFFFIPALFLNTLVFLRLVKYYTTKQRRSWISPRSVTYMTSGKS